MKTDWTDVPGHTCARTVPVQGVWLSLEAEHVSTVMLGRTPQSCHLETRRTSSACFGMFRGCCCFFTYRAPAAHVAAPPEHDHVVTVAQARRVTRPERKTSAGRHHQIKLYKVFVWGIEMKEDLGLSLWG